jgi:hypothetical protein
MSGDSGRLQVLLNGGEVATGTTNAFCSMFSVGRTLDTNGDPDATGIETFKNPGSAGDTNANYQYVPFSGTAVVTTSWPCFVPSFNSGTIGGSQIFPVPAGFGEDGGHNPTTQVAAHDISTLTPGNTIGLSLYGNTVTFLVLGLPNCYVVNGNWRILMRYD